MALQPHELKALAIELAAAMPPAEGQSQQDESNLERADDMYDMGMLRLCQAKALTEVLGVAAKHGDDGIPMIDAAFGIIELMDQAQEAFRKSHRGSKA